MSALADLDPLARMLWSVSGQATLLIALVWLATLASRKASPAFRYGLWCIVLVRLCLPVTLTVPVGLASKVWIAAQWMTARPQTLPATESAQPPAFIERSLPVSEPSAELPQRSELVDARRTLSSAPLAARMPSSWRERLLLSWLGVIACGGALIAWRTLRVARMLRRLPRVERPELAERLRALCTQMGISHPVGLRVADSILGEIGPLTVGVLQPIVVLPRHMIERWPLEHLEPVLAHELAHVRRLDLLVNWAQMIVQLVYVFHPLVWYANWRIRQERELICDDLAVGQLGGERQAYCRSILRVLEETQGNSLLLASGSGMAEARHSLKRRIKRIMDDEYRGYERMRTAASGLMVTVGLACVAVASDAPARSPQHAALVKAQVAAVTATPVQLVSVAPAVPSGSPQTTPPTRTGAASDTLDPETRRTGGEVGKRLTTYSDEQTLTLRDGQSAEMKLKPNKADLAALRITAHIVADGSEFDLAGLDATGRAVPGPATRSATIHDGDSARMALPLADRQDLFCKFQLTPRRAAENQVTVKVEVLFAQPPTEAETRAALLIKGREGHLQLDFKTIGTTVMRYRMEEGRYPESLAALKIDLPKDVYSPRNEPYHYEAERSRFILSSCGQDGVYGNSDDEIFIGTTDGASSGQRHELYPLKPDAGQAQRESVMPGVSRPTGSCLLEGRVVDDRRGAPVGHATVYLLHGGTLAPIFVNVAGDGSFELKNIPCGGLSLSVINTAGFQDHIYNPEGKPGPHPTFTLSEKEQRRGIVLSVKPAYRISGRVLDENGRPPGDLWVVAWQEQADERQAIFARFRIAKQAPLRPDGTYLLDGMEGQPVYVTALDFRAQEKDDAYPIRYWPGVFSRDEAKRVTFDDKTSREGIDFNVTRNGGLILDGRVTDGAGAPVPRALIVVHHADMLFDRVTAYSDAQGHYHIGGLGAGSFLVHADATPQGLVRARKLLALNESATVSHLDFKLQTGVTLSGKIIDDGGADLPIVASTTFGNAQIKGWIPPDNGSYSGAANRHALMGVGRLNVTYFRGEGDDAACDMAFPSASTFVIMGMMAGQTQITFRPYLPDKQVVRITHDGKDITESGIATKPGDKVENVLIVVGKAPPVEKKPSNP